MNKRYTSTSTSAPTLALLHCLERWHRRTIAASLFHQHDPLAYLLNGELTRCLNKLDSQQRPAMLRSNQQKLRPARKNNALVVGYFDPAFPPLLREIPDPPLVLFYRGELNVLGNVAVAVVGARRCTHLGRHNAQTLGRDLTDEGVHVVSGLALGIDAAAHHGALSAQHGAPTIAVLGNGLGGIYPRRHTALAEHIVASGGLLLSEYPDHFGARPYHFPERNRLISGLSLATVVVEANLRSGSLITARFAAEQGRDVFAFPGPIQNETSAGCHQLIKEGAGLVTGVQDVLQNMGLDYAAAGKVQSEQTAALSGNAKRLIAHISGYAVTLDELLLKTELDAQVLAQTLVELEMSGFVEQGPLGYIRTS